MKIKLIGNPRAGKEIIRKIRKAEGFLRRTGAEVHTYITEKKGDAEEWAKKAHDEGFDRVIVAGGDGTINEVVNGIAENGLPVRIVPLGISNVLALELGIPINIERACRVALDGDVKGVTLGKANDRYFSLMAGIGFDGEVVCGLNMRLKPYLGKMSYILSGLKVLITYDPPPIEILTDSGERLKGYSVIIGKSRYYGGRFKITSDAGIEKSELDLCIFQKGKWRDILRYFLGILTGSHLRFKDVIYRKVRSVKIISEGAVSVQIDGDCYGELPLEVSLKSDAVKLVFPK